MRRMWRNLKRSNENSNGSNYPGSLNGKIVNVGIFIHYQPNNGLPFQLFKWLLLTISFSFFLVLSVLLHLSHIFPGVWLNCFGLIIRSIASAIKCKGKTSITSIPKSFLRLIIYFQSMKTLTVNCHYYIYQNVFM